MTCDICPLSLLCLAGPVPRHTAFYCETCMRVVTLQYNFSHGYNEPYRIVDRRFVCQQAEAQTHFEHHACHICRAQQRHRRHQAQRQRYKRPKGER